MKREGEENNKKTTQSDGIHVPWDLTVDIVSRLPVKSLVRFQCVSKQWSSLITDTIMTRSTEPGLLKIFPHRLLPSSVFSSSTYSLNTNYKTFISADKNTSYTLTCGLSCDFKYQCVRGLLCSRLYAMFQSFVLPEMEYNEGNNDGCLWYDLVENQVFTLLRLGSKYHQWRSLDIQGIGNHPPGTTSAGICINGMFYYVARYPDFNKLMRFDQKSERLDHIQMPLALRMNQLENLTLVNYQGNLGCIGTDTAAMWILEDYRNERQEWSRIILVIPRILLENLGDRYCIAGVTPNGHIVIMPNTLDSAAQTLLAYYCDTEENRFRSVEFKIRNESLYLADGFGFSCTIL